LEDQWTYATPDERNTSRSAGQEIWHLRGGSYFHNKVVRRGPFFDAERDNFILGRFATLEEAQRCAELDAKRVPVKRKPRQKRVPRISAAD
jgi:hypothetical protein